MKIVENQSTVAFHDVKIGQVFRAMGYTYLKIDQSNNHQFNAVNLNTNLIAIIFEHEECVLLNAKLVINGVEK